MPIGGYGPQLGMMHTRNGQILLLEGFKNWRVHRKSRRVIKFTRRFSFGFIYCTLQGLMTDTKHQLEDYLAGRTARCPGYNMSPTHGCGQRMPAMDALLCDYCSGQKNHDDFKAEFAKPSDKWYMAWTFFNNTYTTFVCKACGSQQDARNVGIMNAAGELVPAAACCTMTETCKAARDFWGNDGGHVRGKVVHYVRHSGKSPYLRP